MQIKKYIHLNPKEVKRQWTKYIVSEQQKCMYKYPNIQITKYPNIQITKPRIQMYHNCARCVRLRYGNIQG